MFSYIKLFFYHVFYQPLLNALWLLFAVLPGHSFGLAIIILTIVVNLILLPLSNRMKTLQRKQQLVAPELKRLQKQYQGNREELTRKTLALYEEHGINPFAGLLFPFIQIPIFISLYNIFSYGVDFPTTGLYSFISVSTVPEAIFLNIVDLTQSAMTLSIWKGQFEVHSVPALVLVFVASILQYINTGFLLGKQDLANQTEFARAMNIQTKYFLPVLIFFIGLSLPSALSLYWTTLSAFGIVHEVVMRNRVSTHTLDHGGTKPKSN